MDHFQLPSDDPEKWIHPKQGGEHRNQELVVGMQLFNMGQFMAQDLPTRFIFHGNVFSPKQVLEKGEGGILVLGFNKIETIHWGNLRNSFDPVNLVYPVSKKCNQ